MKCQLTAQDIAKLLAQRHSEDIFVSECKDGPSMFGSHSRLDAWVMKKSWTKPLVIGYEIKVSRSDFMRDDKWRSYLDVCNEFYFVAPPKIILPNELPPEAGLLVATTNGARLLKKNKAQYREVTIPEEVYRYILFSRSKIVPPGMANARSKKEEWKQWLEDKEDNYRFGRLVSEEINKYCRTLRHERDEALNKIEKYEAFKQAMKEMGIDPDDVSTWEIRQQARQVLGGLPSGFKYRLHELAKDIQKLHQMVESMEQDDAA